jgi:undecaprenyl-diphosphatase
LAVWLILAVLALRIAYLIWFSPYELSGDEAYYWDWSRHLDLCYYEKGPGLAYLIAACTRVFGDTAWAVRLPVALSFAAAAWIVLRTTVSATEGNQQAGLLAVVCFMVLPAFQANAQICTQDGPMIAIWIAATAIGLRLVRNWESTGSRSADWLALAAVLGIGFLFKQSALLFVPGLGLYALLRRRSLRWDRRLIWQLAASTLAFVAVISPMIIWNQQHGWPTLAHTLGHLSGAGDQGQADRAPWTPLWFLSLVGAQVGAFGPAFIFLAALASFWAIRSRHDQPGRWPARLWLLCSSLPAIGFFAGQSLFKSVLGSWPFACFGPLVVLIADLAVAELPRRRQKIEAWRTSRAERSRPRKPNTLFGAAWDVMVVYGVIGSLLLAFPGVLLHVPVLGPVVERPFAKLSGHRANAAQLQAVLDEVRTTGGRPPIIVCRYYMTSALYAFYLPGHPTVYCAGTLLGKRPSAYDFWKQTDLDAAELRGRTAVLHGGADYPWDRIFIFDHIAPVPQGDYSIGRDYRGVNPSLVGATRR